MAEPPDFVAEYLRLVVGGAEFADPRLRRLLGQMTADEVQRAKELLLAAYVQTLPPAASDAPVLDFADLYVALVRSGARGDDGRLVRLADAMTDDELKRAKAGLGEMWLRAEPRPARPN
jgi:hypothetical protein